MPPAYAFGDGRSLEGGVQGALPLGRLRRCGAGGCLTDGVGKGQQVVGTGTCGGCRHRQAHHFPAARDSQGVSMLFTQVVTVRLGVRCQGPQDGGGVGVDVRQSGHR